MSVPTMPGIHVHTTTTPRLTTRVLMSGSDDAVPVLFLHGNASSATFWEETMLALPERFRGIAPDQRGYGDAQRDRKIDATRGMGDFADDAIALLDTLGIDRAHVVGHSMGGSVVWRLLMDHPERFLSATQVNPGSPYGFGGTKGLDGQPCYDDFAGSGGGVVSPAFADAIRRGDRSDDANSPRQIMNSYYFKPPFRSPREEDLLLSVLSEHIGDHEYPGDVAQSPNWPFVAPGAWGPANALSPKYADDVARLYAIEPKPPILWIRGSDDQIVGDKSLFDVGTLGALGVIPGCPGDDVFPSQPMVGQTRRVLEQYRAAGGAASEVVIEDAGHTPYLEKPDEFNRHFFAFLQAHTPAE